jgi:hypothetical protein
VDVNVDVFVDVDVIEFWASPPRWRLPVFRSPFSRPCLIYVYVYVHDHDHVEPRDPGIQRFMPFPDEDLFLSAGGRGAGRRIIPLILPRETPTMPRKVFFTFVG